LNIEMIKEVAIAEILNPTFELTKQYLKSIEICVNNNVPVIEDIEIDQTINTAAVYFPIKKQSFYFVIYVKDMEVDWVNTSAGNNVYLFACSQEVTTDEMLSSFQLEPTEKWNINDQIGKCGRRKHNGFIFQPINKMTGEVESKLNTLLDLLLPRNRSIVELSQKAEVEIQIEYHGYKDEMLGINLDSTIVKKLTELGLGIDIDLYASGRDLDD